jgi:UPF0716 protein FxsA
LQGRKSNSGKIIPMKRLGIGLGLLALPLLEIALLIRAGQKLGLWPVMAIIVGTGILGIAILVRQRFAVVSGVMNAVNDGKPPLAPVLNGAFMVLAGGLLFSPGLLCDTAGLLLLIPQVRRLVAQWSISRLMRDAEVHVTTFGEGRVTPGEREGGPIIEGEFERLGERRADLDSDRGRKR